MSWITVKIKKFKNADNNIQKNATIVFKISFRTSWKTNIMQKIFGIYICNNDYHNLKRIKFDILLPISFEFYFINIIKIIIIIIINHYYYEKWEKIIIIIMRNYRQLQQTFFWLINKSLFWILLKVMLTPFGIILIWFKSFVAAKQSGEGRRNGIFDSLSPLWWWTPTILKHLNIIHEMKSNTCNEKLKNLNKI